MRKTLLAGIASALLMSACGGEKPAAPAVPPEPPKAAVGTFGVDLAQIDTSVKAGDDFYRYVNGKWLDNFQMPADRASYSTGTMVFDTTQAQVRAIVDELAETKGAPGTNQQKIGDLYTAWMDEAGIEARGTDPLKPYLGAIDAVTTKADLMEMFGSLDYTAPFSVGVEVATVDPTKYTVWVYQSGLGMPRDYYLSKGDEFDAYRAAYKDYVTTIFKLIGDTDPAGSATKTIALEMEIAKVAWSPERQRNIKEVNNPMDRAGLKKLAPAIDWDVVLSGVNLADANDFLVNETTAIRDGGKLVDTVAIDDWKKYLVFHFVNGATSFLPKGFDDASFNFYSKALNGAEKKRDRWKRGISWLGEVIGEGLGEIYVQRHFSADSKIKVDALVANLRAALKARLETATWMDNATRAEAIKKLDKVEARIGLPDKWRDYSKLTIEPGKLFENMRASQKYEWDRQVARLKGPVDRSEWIINPQTVEAYYNGQTNQITLTAAILQPPFFDPNADPAVNYGSIGAVIGHEIGHGFDDQGREFDSDGKVRNWWSAETNRRFVETTTKLAARYDAFCPLPASPKECVNGRFTMGENLGDLGGLEMAYTAYKLSLGGKEAPVIDGFTGDQRFFLAWAQVWRAKQRDDDLLNQMRTDPHAPSEFRVNGVVPNIDEWYAAFNIQPTDKMYIPPEKRVRIW
jgi:putative endopeptidase